MDNHPSYPIRRHHRLGPLRSTVLVASATTAAALAAAAATRLASATTTHRSPPTNARWARRTSATTARWTRRAPQPNTGAAPDNQAVVDHETGAGRVPPRNIAKRFLCGALPAPTTVGTGIGLIAGAATIVWLRRPAGGKRRPLSFAVVDTETTGLDVALDRVIEVAVVHADGLGRLTDTFTWRTRPEDGRHGAEHIHHISEADLADAPVFGEVADQVSQALRGRTLVAHNAPFDTRFLSREYARAGQAAPGALVRPMCTLELARKLGMAPLRLSEVARALGTPQPATAHRATDDAIATAQLLTPLLDRAGIAHANELPLVDGTRPHPKPRRPQPGRLRRFNPAGRRRGRRSGSAPNEPATRGQTAATR